MFCSKCGNKLGSSDLFCSKCGMKIGGAFGGNGSLRKITNKCDACGAPSLKEIRKGRYLCEYCGSEYITNEQAEVLESKLAEKELVDVFAEADRYHKADQYQKELACLLKAVDQAPGNITLLNKLGWAYYWNHCYDEALKCYEKAVALEPESATAYGNIGTVYHHRAQYVEAERYMRKAIEMMEQNPGQYPEDYPQHLVYLAYTVARLGRTAEATALIIKAEAHGYKYASGARKILKAIEKNTNSAKRR